MVLELDTKTTAAQESNMKPCNAKRSLQHQTLQYIINHRVNKEYLPLTRHAKTTMLIQISVHVT